MWPHGRRGRFRKQWGPSLSIGDGTGYAGSGVFRSSAGVITNLKGLNGTNLEAHAQSVNKVGEIVGNCVLNGAVFATAWVGGTASKLATPSNVTFMLADSLNDLGQIVGSGQETLGGVREVQSLSESGAPSGGSFTLTVTSASETTGPIPYNATATTVQSALKTLSYIDEIGGVSCTGGPLPSTPISITFYPYSAQPLLSIANSLTGGTKPAVSVTQIEKGVSPTYKTVGLYWPSATANPSEFALTNFVPAQIVNDGEVVGWVGENISSYSPNYTYYKLSTTANSEPVALGSTSVAPSIAVNASGTIVMRAGTDGVQAIEVSPFGTQTVIGDNCSQLSINSAGDVAGMTFQPSTGTIPFIWTKARGLRKLTNYLPANSGWTNLNPTAINGTGLVTGYGTYEGAIRGFLLQLPTGAF